MTDVWRTRGLAYHSRADCAGIFEGQAKAAAEGKPTYPPELVPLASLQREGIAPCLRCWPQEEGWLEWKPLELATEHHSGAKDGSKYELDFLLNVLLRVPGLEARHVRVQHEVRTRYGVRVPDFVLDLPGHQPIAIEIDGENKTEKPQPGGRERSLKRDSELEGAGYRVQHFTNRQVVSDVGWCIDQVTRLVAEARHRPQVAVPAKVDSPATRPQPVTQHKVSKAWALVFCVAAFLVIGLAAWTWVAAQDREPAELGGPCDADHPIRGNVSASGEKIYHQPGWEYYDRTLAEECFASSEDAERAGYRASKVR